MQALSRRLKNYDVPIMSSAEVLRAVFLVIVKKTIQMKNALALDILCVGGGGKTLPTGFPFSFSPQHHNISFRAREHAHGGRDVSVRVNYRTRVRSLVMLVTNSVTLHRLY